MDKWSIFLTIVLVLLLIWLSYQMFLAPEWDTKTIAKLAVVIVGYIAAIARHHMTTRKRDAAVSELAGSTFSDDPASRHALTKALLLMSRAKFEKAAERFSALQDKCKTNDAHAILYMYEGMCYKGIDRDIPARRAFEKVLEHDPTSSMAHFYLGTLCARAGDVAGTFREYSDAVRLDPENAAACCNLANLCVRAGKAEEAVTLAKRALLKDPTLYQAMSAACIGCAMLGRSREALEWLERYSQNGGKRADLEAALREVSAQVPSVDEAVTTEDDDEASEGMTAVQGGEE